jgi:type I restriction enzyme M protein
MWLLHFLYHLKPGGTAGFVMATGELSNSETARLEVRKALVEGDYVDCVVQLTGQLFANTQIPCCLWFLSKGRAGASETAKPPKPTDRGFRRRAGEILFIDGRRLGSLIPGSRKQKQLAAEEVEKVAGVYRAFRRAGSVSDRSSLDQPGFCKVATVEEVRGHKYALTPGRYVGSAEADDDGEPFEEKLPRLTAQLRAQMQESARLDRAITAILDDLGNGTGG